MVGATWEETWTQQEFAGAGRTVRCAKGERIFPKGPEEDSVALVEEGLVYLCAENEQYARGILSFFRPGEVMDAAMLLSLGQGVCYFMAKYPARLAVFHRQEALASMAAHPQAEAWGRRLTQMAQDWMWQGYMLRQRSPRQRLMAFFRREAQRQGGPVLRLPLPQSDLAEFLGVDRAAMARELTRMKREGLLSGSRRDWTLLERK